MSRGFGINSGEKRSQRRRFKGPGAPNWHHAAYVRSRFDFAGYRTGVFAESFRQRTWIQT